MHRLDRFCIRATIGCLGLFFSLCSLPVHADAGLSGLYQRARSHDPVWAAATAARDAGREYEAIGRAGLLPSISGLVESTRTGIDRQPISPASPQESYRYPSHGRTLRLTQPLLDLSRIAGYREGATRALLADVVYADAGQDLVLRVSEAYFNHLLARDSLELATAQKEATAAQKTQAEHLYKAGVATVTDVEESSARYQIAEAQELAASNALALRRRELMRIVGPLREDEFGQSVGSFQVSLPEPNSLDTWLAAAREQNLRISAQKIQVDISGLQVDQQRAGHLPSVALVGNYSKTDRASYNVGEQDSSSLSVQVTIPIFEGGRVSAVSRQAVANREKAMQELESARREAEIKTSQAFLEVVGGVARIAAYEQALKSSQITLEGMEAGQRAGLRTNSDVLNALQQVYTVRRDLQRERYAYLMNRLQLKAAVGALASEELGLIDEMVRR